MPYIACMCILYIYIYTYVCIHVYEGIVRSHGCWFIDGYYWIWNKCSHLYQRYFKQMDKVLRGEPLDHIPDMLSIYHILYIHHCHCLLLLFGGIWWLPVVFRISQVLLYVRDPLRWRAERARCSASASAMRRQAAKQKLGWVYSTNKSHSRIIYYIVPVLCVYI